MEDSNDIGLRTASRLQAAPHSNDSTLWIYLKIFRHVECGEKSICRPSWFPLLLHICHIEWIQIFSQIIMLDKGKLSKQNTFTLFN